MIDYFSTIVRQLGFGKPFCKILTTDPESFLPLLRERLGSANYVLMVIDIDQEFQEKKLSGDATCDYHNKQRPFSAYKILEIQKRIQKDYPSKNVFVVFTGIDKALERIMQDPVPFLRGLGDDNQEAAITRLRREDPESLSRIMFAEFGFSSINLARELLLEEKDRIGQKKDGLFSFIIAMNDRNAGYFQLLCPDFYRYGVNVIGWDSEDSKPEISYPKTEPL